MKVTGTAVLHAAPDVVYAALNDPAVLTRTIPGCESLTELGDDRYAMAVTAGVAAIKGTYQGEVALAEQQPPHSFVLRAKGSGAPGTVDTTVQVTLSDAGDGTTRLDYAADAAVGGMVGGVGQRMLSGVARKMAGQFFAAVDADLLGERAVPVPAAAAPGSQDAPAQAHRSGVEVGDHPQHGYAAADNQIPWPALLAAFGAGAFWALAGVLVGWRITRRSGRGRS